MDQQAPFKNPQASFASDNGITNDNATTSIMDDKSRTIPAVLENHLIQEYSAR